MADACLSVDRLPEPPALKTAAEDAWTAAQKAHLQAARARAAGYAQGLAEARAYRRELAAGLARLKAEAGTADSEVLRRLVLDLYAREQHDAALLERAVAVIESFKDEIRPIRGRPLGRPWWNAALLLQRANAIVLEGVEAIRDLRVEIEMDLARRDNDSPGVMLESEEDIDRLLDLV